MARKILIVDDEPNIADTLKAYFEAAGYTAAVAYGGVEALSLHKEFRPDVVVLDLMLPDIGGEQVCILLRAESDVPIVMLTAKSQDESFVNGLRIGADDYLTKPFGPKLLVAKIDALLRRVAGGKEAEIAEFVCDEIALNHVAHTVRKRGEPVNLTPGEYNILLAMMREPGKAFSRRELIAIAFGEGYDSDERMVDSYVKQLRQKIEDDAKLPKYILTVRGFGYKLGGGAS
ncbi:MAG: response regulator transcription factor [Clostridiales Family XIII bacterium]|jgi:DNA-binding response OmpR family regulator|nr:response regulator transcription factor [Clostridiales Family XIII bacterium]